MQADRILYWSWTPLPDTTEIWFFVINPNWPAILSPFHAPGYIIYSSKKNGFLRQVLLKEFTHRIHRLFTQSNQIFYSSFPNLRQIQVLENWKYFSVLIQFHSNFFLFDLKLRPEILANVLLDAVYFSKASSKKKKERENLTVKKMKVNEERKEAKNHASGSKPR